MLTYVRHSILQKPLPSLDPDAFSTTLVALTEVAGIWAIAAAVIVTVHIITVAIILIIATIPRDPNAVRNVLTGVLSLLMY